MAVCVPDFDRNLTAVILRQAVTPDLRSGRGLAFGCLQAVELKAVFIGDEPHPLTHLEDGTEALLSRETKRCSLSLPNLNVRRRD
jgi:hypothetical protein